MNRADKSVIGGSRMKPVKKSQIKLLIILALLSTTVFIKGCDGGLNEESHPFFSMGFPLPYLELTPYENIRASLSNPLLPTIIVNILFSAFCILFIFKYKENKRVNINVLLGSVSFSVLLNHGSYILFLLPASKFFKLFYIFFEVIFVLKLLGIAYIQDFLNLIPFLEIDDFNISSRILFFLLTVAIYFLLILFRKFFSIIKRRLIPWIKKVSHPAV